MEDTEKRIIKKSIYSEDFQQIINYQDGLTFEKLIELFDIKIKWLKEMQPEWTEITFNFDNESGYYGSSSFVAEFFGSRLETDEEVNKRLEIAKKAAITKKENEKLQKLKKEEQDKKDYERLKAKFG